MVSRFELRIQTLHGASNVAEDANDAGQIERLMPMDVTTYSILGEKPRPGVAPVEDYELFANLDQTVQQLEYASSLTPETVAELESNQLEALRGLSFHVSAPVSLRVLSAASFDVGRRYRIEIKPMLVADGTMIPGREIMRTVVAPISVDGIEFIKVKRDDGSMHLVAIEAIDEFAAFPDE